MKLKNVIFDIQTREYPKLRYHINPADHNREETVVVCDDDDRLRNWQEKGFPCIGVENGRRISAAKYVTDSLAGIDEEYISLVYHRFHGLPMTISETNRLILREMTVKDLPALYEIYQGNVLHFVEPLYDYPKELEFTENYIENMYGFYGYGLWLVIRKSDDRIIGRAGLSNRMVDGENEVELGYLIGEAYQGNGYAYEACSSILDYAFERLRLPRLICCIDKENLPSIRLAGKLDFVALDCEQDSQNVRIFVRNAY